jgi:arylsulfatase A-like enzyme
MQRTWLFVPAVLSVALLAQAPPAPRRNIVIFVADGLRHGSVNERDMPTLSALRAEGVDFQNSYAVYPTFTMANASAIATGHRLGDTGVFSNSIWTRFRAFDTGTFGVAQPTTPVPSLENDQVLGDVDRHYGGNVLAEKTLLAMAREHGYNTGAIGKLGPATLQDVASISPEGASFPKSPATIIVDDATGGATGIPLPLPVLMKMQQAGLAPQPPPRAVPNVAQQQWLADAATRVVLPMFERDLTQAAKPFALVFWSRDPDGAQHGENDSPGRVSPGINGPTPLLGLQNADRNLKQILDWLKARPAIDANTDVLVTSDHGFATISRKEIDASGRTTTSPAATRAYVAANGRVDTEKGTLPAGFLAIDLAAGLHLNLFDPDRRAGDGEAPPFHKVRLESGPGHDDQWEHPAMGSGLLGTVVDHPDGSDARAIVAANGGSDLIYVPDGNADTVRAIVQQLLTYDYVSSIFVDDRFPGIPGTLPLSAIGLVGSTPLPRPAIVVGFKVFYVNPDDIQTAVQITDTPLLEGQGHHGGFGRDTTFNTMAARGPDFRRGFADPAPVSNADIAETLAHVLGFDLAPTGTLRGRVMREALAGGAAAPAADLKYLASPVANGLRTALYYRELDGERYGETACRVPDDRQDPASAAACRR